MIWFELPDGLVVGQTVVMPEDARGAVASALRSALTQPEVGLPRQPHGIRVPDAATAAEVRTEVAGEIPVTVAPTPELDALFDQVIASMQGEGDEASYFEDGRVSADAIEKLFTAGRFLFEITPWTFAYDSQVLRMDIPALGVDGACVYVIGQLDESPGFLIFASFDGFQQFLAAGTTDAIGQDPDALGSELLALMFLRAGELPPSMRREAMEHAWPVASADAYPLVERRNPDGTLCRLVEQDIEIAAACALSLSAFFGKHAAMFKSDNFAPVCESYFDDDDLEVRFTVPYEAFADFDMTESTEPALNSPALATPFHPIASCAPASPAEDDDGCSSSLRMRITSHPSTGGSAAPSSAGNVRPARVRIAQAAQRSPSRSTRSTVRPQRRHCHVIERCRIRTASIRSGLALETGRASPRRPSTPSTEPLRAEAVSIAARPRRPRPRHPRRPRRPRHGRRPRRHGRLSCAHPFPTRRFCLYPHPETLQPVCHGRGRAIVRASIATLTVSRSISSTLRRPSATSAAHGARRLPGRGRW